MAVSARTDEIGAFFPSERIELLGDGVEERWNDAARGHTLPGKLDNHVLGGGFYRYRIAAVVDLGDDGAVTET